MNKTIRITGIVSLSLLIAGTVMKLLYIPDQVIILVAGIILFILIILPAFLVFSLKRSSGWKEKLLHSGGFIFCFVLPVSFIVFLQMRPPATTVITIGSGILVLAYFILLVLKRNDILDEKIKWPFIASYLSVMILVYLNLPVEVQGADKFYSPPVPFPAYAKKAGPVICIDQGHNNFHTLNDRLRSTGQLLRKDGYKVVPYEGTFESGKLKECRILMIVNALHESNLQQWTLPTPSAFSVDEIKTVREWVKEGGSLLLVADHMPFAGAAAELASQFGFTLHNGYAMDTLSRNDYFCRADSTLHDNMITRGFHANEGVDSILTFTGHAFEIPADATPIMTFSDDYLQWCPDTAGRFEHTVPRPIAGFCQGAFIQYGKGRVVVLGEAMMITAQLIYGLHWNKMGMNSGQAPYNYQLVLNIVRWLDEEE